MAGTTVIGFDLSHVPEDGQDDPMSAAILAVGTSAAVLLQSPGDVEMVRAALTEIPRLGRAFGLTAAADFAESVTTLLDLIDDCIKEG